MNPAAGPIAPAVPSARSAAWRRWLRPRPFDAVAALLYLSTLGLFVYERALGLYGHPWRAEQGALMIAATAGLLLLDRGAFYRYGETPPLRPALALLGLRIALIETMAQLDDFSFSPFLYLLIPFTAALYFGSRVSVAVAAGVWLIYLAKISLYGVRWYAVPADLHTVLTFTLGLIFALAMARVVERERQNRARAEGLLAQVQAYAQQVAGLAAAEERNRMARDIHDSLGHYLTAIHVQLELAQTLRTVRPPAADAAVGAAQRLAHEALQEVRRSVGTLRADGAPPALTQALPALIAEGRRGGLDVTLQLTGDPAVLPAPLQTALYRAIQEGLTNIRKHAAATAATVTLGVGRAEVHLAICDNGRGEVRTAGGPAEGYGLAGLRERLEPLGGSLALTRRRGGGMCLAVRCPWVAPMPVGATRTRPEGRDDPT